MIDHHMTSSDVVRLITNLTKENSMTMEASAKRQPQIEESLTQLQNTTDFLHHSIAELEKRLESVITPPHPEIEVKKDPGKTVLVPLADALDIHITRINIACEKINSLTRRVEL